MYQIFKFESWYFMQKKKCRENALTSLKVGEIEASISENIRIYYW